MVDADVYAALTTELRPATGKLGSMTFEPPVVGFERVSLDLQRDEYGARYLLVYYTVD